MDEKLLIDVSRLEEGGETFEGEVDAIDLEEEFVHPFGGIRYSLYVQALGSELLVKGKLEQDFDLVCSRCGEDFDTTIKVEDFVTSVQIDEKNAEIDLTEEVREAIILNLPSYPICDEDCSGIQQTSAALQDDRWGALNNLKVEGE